MPLGRIAICVNQVPFMRGGAETLVEGLQMALTERGYQAEIVRLPFKWYPNTQVLRNCLAWRLIDLTESDGSPIDAVICTNFPSYAVEHPRKVVWLVHQFRHAYDLFGTPYSSFTNSAEDQEIRSAVQSLDRQTLGEAVRRFAISGNVAHRLEKYSGLDATPLYPPPPRPEVYRCGPPGDYLLWVSRLDRLKRGDLLLRSLAETRSGVRCRVVGGGPLDPELRRLAQNLGIADRVEFLGHVDEDHLIDLYAGALAVFFAPYDEDYGYVTVEAFLSGKAVLTAIDSGGSLEFVRDGENGLIRRPDPADFAEAIDRLVDDPAWAAQLGLAGRCRAREITWDRTIDALLGGL